MSTVNNNSERIRKAELARRTGFSRAWISKLAKDGKLLFGDDGKIDYAQALQQLEGSKDHNREGQRAHAVKQRGGKTAGVSQALMGDESIYDNAGNIIYGDINCEDSKIGVETQRSRLVRETLEAKLKEIQLQREKGELVPIGAVKEANQRIASSVRSKFLSLPTKAAQQCEGKKAKEIQRILEDVVNGILSEIKGME